GRARRQLRADQAGRDRRAQRRAHLRSAQSRRRNLRHRVEPLRQEPLCLPRDADRQEGKEAGDQLGRRDRQGHARRARRGDRPSESAGSGLMKPFLRALAAIAALTAAAPAYAATGIGGAIDPVVYELMVFVMAIFVGYYVVWSVTPALHPPLMSVTNAISSVIVVGALLAVAVEHGGLDGFMSGSTLASKVFGVLALVMASVNIF